MSTYCKHCGLACLPYICYQCWKQRNDAMDPLSEYEAKCLREDLILSERKRDVLEKSVAELEGMVRKMSEMMYELHREVRQHVREGRWVMAQAEMPVHWSQCPTCKNDLHLACRICDAEDVLQRDKRIAELEGMVQELAASLEKSREEMKLSLRYFEARCSNCDDYIEECPCTCLSGPGIREVCSALGEAVNHGHNLLVRPDIAAVVKAVK